MIVPKTKKFTLDVKSRFAHHYLHKVFDFYQVKGNFNAFT